MCFRAGACPGTSDPFLRWAYDKAGNRLAEQRPGSSTSYVYDARDRLLSAGSTSYAYDENGNEVSAGSGTFAYDLANRVRSTTQGGTITTYAYDGDGVRLRASTGSQASRTTDFVWDVNGGLPQIASERDGNGKLLRRYVYGVHRISQTAGNSTSYFAYDGLGSVANLVSSTGGTQWTWSYEPFGSSGPRRRPGQPARDLHALRRRVPRPDRALPPAREAVRPGGGTLPAAGSCRAVSNESVISGYAYAADRPTVMVDPSGEVFAPADEGPTSAWFAGSLVDWTTPGVRCQSPLCSRDRLRPVLRVHPIPRGISTWGGSRLHATSSLPGYPRSISGGAGHAVLAVEAGYVRELGSADVGAALYLRGSSGIDYWYGHIRRSTSKGQVARRGQVIGRTVRHYNGDHLHLGANANIGGSIIGRRRSGST